MVGYDSGKFEVKIESIEYRGCSSRHCDSMLPHIMLFTLRSYKNITYDPQPIVSSYSIPEFLDRGGCTMDLRKKQRT